MVNDFGTYYIKAIYNKTYIKLQTFLFTNKIILCNKYHTKCLQEVTYHLRTYYMYIFSLSWLT